MTDPETRPDLGPELPDWLAGLTPDNRRRLLALWRARDGRETGPDPNICGEILSEAGGLDPVLAVADGRVDLIPDAGWLVAGQARPGGGFATIRVSRFGPGGFSPGSCHDNREQYAAVKLHYQLESGSYQTREIACEPPNFPGRQTEPCERFGNDVYLPLKFDEADISELKGGGRLIARSQLFRGGRVFATMDWRQPDGSNNPLPVNRIAASRQEVEAIVGQIGLGIGLGSEDISSLAAESVAGFSQSPAEAPPAHHPDPFGSSKPPAPAATVNF